MTKKARRITSDKGHWVIAVILRDGWQVRLDDARVEVLGNRRLGEDQQYEITYKDEEGETHTRVMQCTDPIFKYQHSRA